jgi:hypothetical protein
MPLERPPPIKAAPVIAEVFKKFLRFIFTFTTAPPNAHSSVFRQFFAPRLCLPPCGTHGCLLTIAQERILSRRIKAKIEGGLIDALALRPYFQLSLSVEEQ